MDPVGALIGTVLLAIGSMLLYGAIKNRKVFGSGGILTMALTTGDITPSEQVAEAYPRTLPVSGPGSSTNPIIDAIDDIFAGNTSQVTPGPAVKKAIANIAETDDSLATLINSAVYAVDSGSDKVTLMPLRQLLVIADAKGHTADVNVIKSYVKGVTGESI